MAVETYQCQKCKVVYEGPAGPTCCPSCRSIWVDWLSFEKNFGDR